jgi:hypothetical protein
MQKVILKLRIASLLLISAGYGWAGGHYIPADSVLSAYIFQVIILTILIILSIRFLGTSTSDGAKKLGSTTGLTIFVTLSLLINIANIIHGSLYANKVSFGSHNSFADLVPIVFIITGATLWLFTLTEKNKLKMNV